MNNSPARIQPAGPTTAAGIEIFDSQSGRTGSRRATGRGDRRRTERQAGHRLRIARRAGPLRLQAQPQDARPQVRPTAGNHPATAARDRSRTTRPAPQRTGRHAHF